MCLTWGTQCDVRFGSELTATTGNLLLDPGPEPFMRLQPDRRDDGRRVGDYIYRSGGRSGSLAYPTVIVTRKSSRHRGSNGLDDRITLLRWARILSFANTLRRRRIGIRSCSFTSEIQEPHGLNSAHLRTRNCTSLLNDISVPLLLVVLF